MNRIDHNLDQGSDTWIQFRLEHLGASEAAAMLGISPYMTRTELLTMKKSGIAKEFSDFVQSRILDKGHEIEALARPIIEARIGEDLYPVTISRGKLSASCDGLTMDDTIGFECKQFNKSLFEAVDNGAVPAHYMPQVQQCLYVTGADKWIFTVSDGTEENTRTVDVYPDPEYIDEILKAWAQFEKDLADFVPVSGVALEARVDQLEFAGSREQSAGSAPAPQQRQAAAPQQAQRQPDGGANLADMDDDIPF